MIKMPEQVPPSVSRSFEALIPVAFVIIIMSLVTVVFSIDLHHVVDKLATPLVKAGDSYFGVMIPVFFNYVFFGHSESMVCRLLELLLGHYGKYI